MSILRNLSFACVLFQSNQYVAIANYDPKDDDELAISEGTVVDVMEGAQEGDLWVVRTINDDGTYGEEGLVPSAYLEKDSEEELAKRRRSIGVETPKDNKEIEALKLRELVFFLCAYIHSCLRVAVMLGEA